MFTLKWSSTTGIIAAGVFDTARPPLSGGGTEENSGGVPSQKFATSFNYEGSLPEGPITLTVTGYTTQVSGPWVVKWTTDTNSSVRFAPGRSTTKSLHRCFRLGVSSG